MAAKTNCARCGKEILQATADANDGKCIPCKQQRGKNAGTKKEGLSFFIIGIVMLAGVALACFAMSLIEELAGRVEIDGLLLCGLGFTLWGVWRMLAGKWRNKEWDNG